MNRRDFMVGALASAAGRLELGDTPRVGRDEIADVEAAAIQVRLRAARHGGEAQLARSMQVAGQAQRLLGARVPIGLHRDLHTAVGWLLAVTGQACHDASHDGQAGVLWIKADYCAREAGNMSLHARVLALQARQAFWVRDDPEDAAERLDEALSHRGLSPTEEAFLFALLAQADARAGEIRPALHAVELADEAWLRVRTAETSDRPWVAHYDRALHLGETAEALCLVTPQNPESTDRYLQSIGAYTASAKGAKVLSWLSLATTALDIDPAWAVGEGHHAVTEAQSMRSARVRGEVGRLGDAAERLTGLYPDTGELVQRCRRVALA